MKFRYKNTATNTKLCNDRHSIFFFFLSCDVLTVELYLVKKKVEVL